MVRPDFQLAQSARTAHYYYLLRTLLLLLLLLSLLLLLLLYARLRDRLIHDPSELARLCGVRNYRVWWRSCSIYRCRNAWLAGGGEEGRTGVFFLSVFGFSSTEYHCFAILRFLSDFYRYVSFYQANTYKRMAESNVPVRQGFHTSPYRINRIKDKWKARGSIILSSWTEVYVRYVTILYRYVQWCL